MSLHLPPCIADEVLAALVVTQTVYTLVQQKSLVPLLALSIRQAQEGPERRASFSQRLFSAPRFVGAGVLLLWLASLLVLPAFHGRLERLAAAGEVNAFWYAFTKPMSYQSATFMITALYAWCAAAVAVFASARFALSMT